MNATFSFPPLPFSEQNMIEDLKNLKIEAQRKISCLQKNQHLILAERNPKDSIEFIEFCREDENFVLVGSWDQTLRIYHGNHENGTILQKQKVNVDFFPLKAVFWKPSHFIVQNDHLKLILMSGEKFMTQEAIFDQQVDKFDIDDEHNLILSNKTPKLFLFNL